MNGAFPNRQYAELSIFQQQKTKCNQFLNEIIIKLTISKKKVININIWKEKLALKI